MASHEVSDTPLLKVLDAILRLHNLAIAERCECDRLYIAGKHESWEAESVRLSVQASWAALTNEERLNATMFSEWLSNLENGGYALPAQLTLKIDTPKPRD